MVFFSYEPHPVWSSTWNESVKSKMDKQRRLTLKERMVVMKEITTKNQTQLNYLYGEEVTNVLKSAIKQSIKNGNCVTISIDELDKFSYKHMVIAKVKLFFKRLFK